MFSLKDYSIKQINDLIEVGTPIKYYNDGFLCLGMITNKEYSESRQCVFLTFYGVRYGEVSFHKVWIHPGNQFFWSILD